MAIFVMLTFTYLVILIVPFMIYFRVPRSLALCGIFLTYMSEYRKPIKGKPEEESGYMFEKDRQLNSRLKQLVPDVFDLLYLPEKTSGEQEIPKVGYRTFLAEDWLKETQAFLADSVDDWLKVVDLRSEVEKSSQLYAAKLTQIEGKLLNAQRVLLSYNYKADGAPHHFTTVERLLLDKNQSVLGKVLDQVKRIKILQL